MKRRLHRPLLWLAFAAGVLLVQLAPVPVITFVLAVLLGMVGVAVLAPRRPSTRPVIIHLGGNWHRAWTTRRVAARFPDATVLLSAEAFPRLVIDVLGTPTAANPVPRIAQDLGLEFDYRPWDTLTHFTAIALELAAAGIDVLHVVTDRFHLRRAVWLARIVLAGLGIRVVGHAHHDPAQAARRDPWLRLVKDLVAAVWWRATGLLVRDRRIRTERQPAFDRAQAELHAMGLL